ncbi:MAG: hypothetical protein R3Y12_05420 [Clostridia bacterium]
MVKKTITYTDYNGAQRTEDFYFNLTKAEVTEMELSVDGGMSETLNRIIQANNVPALIKEFKDIVLKAYGEKSQDGKRFIKDDETTKAFKETEAYSQLFMELVTNSDEASKFVNGILPQEIEQLSKQ